MPNVGRGSTRAQTFAAVSHAKCRLYSIVLCTTSPSPPFIPVTSVKPRDGDLYGTLGLLFRGTDLLLHGLREIEECMSLKDHPVSFDHRRSSVVALRIWDGNGTELGKRLISVAGAQIGKIRYDRLNYGTYRTPTCLLQLLLRTSLKFASLSS